MDVFKEFCMLWNAARTWKHTHWNTHFAVITFCLRDVSAYVCTGLHCMSVSVILCVFMTACVCFACVPCCVKRQPAFLCSEDDSLFAPKHFKLDWMYAIRTSVCMQQKAVFFSSEATLTAGKASLMLLDPPVFFQLKSKCLLWKRGICIFPLTLYEFTPFLK